MARDWRRCVWTAFAAAMLVGACALAAVGQSAAQQPAEAEEEGESASKGGPEAAPEGAPGGSKGRKRQDPAEAQRTIEGALKQVQAGRAEQAAQALSATLSSGNLPPAIMAKALYVRGLAYRRQGRQAQAISDFTSALWLRGGLGGDDRDAAIRDRAAAYADAGMPDPGEAQAPASKGAASSSNWLSGLFGGFPGLSPAPSSPPPPPPPKVAVAPPVERPEPPAAAPAKAPAVSTGWSNKVEVQEAPKAAPKAAAPKAPKAKAAPPPKTQAAAARPAPAAPAAPAGKKGDGRFLVQLAAKRTEAEAQALASKAKREHGAVLSARGQSIDRAVFGNMGAFYRVRFGPFANAQEAQSACAKLQAGGIDCMSVAR